MGVWEDGSSADVTLGGRNGAEWIEPETACCAALAANTTVRGLPAIVI